MRGLKKYETVNPSFTEHSFNIQRMEEIWERHQGQPDEPHRHSYYTIVFPKRATGRHIIDFHEFDLAANQVYFVSPDQVHQIIEEEQSFGYALTFNEAFLIENNIQASFIQDLHLFQQFGYAPPLEPTESQAERLSDYCEQMIGCLDQIDTFTYSYVGALLKIFLIECNRYCTREEDGHTQSQQAAVTILREFKALLNSHYRDQHKVKEYAEMLHITPDYLNASLKKFTGKSAKDHIQSKLIIEAKRMLKFTDMSSKEVGYQLGFSEAANFSQFFKKHTDLSPSQFVG